MDAPVLVNPHRVTLGPSAVTEIVLPVAGVALSTGEATASETSARPRLLLAFQSADTALSFAQGAGLGNSPRLIALSLSQALAALIQRNTISALLIAAEDDPAITPHGLPSGLRIERATLIELLAGVTP